MFSNKENVNILTSLLVQYGVRHAVVCPGSRNAPIVHNLNECEQITCCPVTDERSAGFQAIGLSMAAGCQPVAVCVTSGSALLNLYPAVAEAYYQHIPLVVISADRPAQWIGQLDGQTLPQPDALGRMVRKAVNLPEVFEGKQHDEQHWYCNRLVNEALLACTDKHPAPVHINVPISEPLYEFAVAALPEERKIERLNAADVDYIDSILEKKLPSVKRPLVVMGQLPSNLDYTSMLYWYRKFPVLWESLAMPPYLYSEDDYDGEMELEETWNYSREYGAFENLLDKIKDDERFRPDLIVYAGGHIVSKKLKAYLRTLQDVEQIRVTGGDSLEDTFMHLTHVVDIPLDYVSSLLDVRPVPASWEQYRKLWLDALTESVSQADAFTPTYSSLLAVKLFWNAIKEVEPMDYIKCPTDSDDYIDHEYVIENHPFGPNVNSAVFSGNSSAIRLMNLFADRHVYCNRGVNGIEGSLSAAVGYARHPENTQKVFCVLGDLSFFYDQNALWSQNLSGNLRIIVLNNGGGAIFSKFEGLRQSEAREQLVMAKHHTSAQGICEQNHVAYLSAHDEKELQEAIHQLVTATSDSPMLLEVFTDIDTDNSALEAYHKFQISNIKVQNK